MRTIIPKNARLVPKEAKQVFKGVIYDVYHWQQKMFDGNYTTYELLKRPDTVKIIAVKDNKLILLQEEQPDLAPFYDIPTGKHDNDKETELQAAKRELLEETGMSFHQWKLLDVIQPSDSIEQFVYFFLATDFNSQVEQKLETGEKISVQLVDIDTFKKTIKHPNARYLPKELFERVNSIEELLSLPAYT